LRKTFKKKRGKLPISRRYDLLPLLPSDPDGVHRELAVWNLPHIILNNQYIKKINPVDFSDPGFVF